MTKNKTTEAGCDCCYYQGSTCEKCNERETRSAMLQALRMVASNEANMAGCDRVTQGMIRAAIAKATGQEGR